MGTYNVYLWDDTEDQISQYVEGFKKAAVRLSCDDGCTFEVQWAKEGAPRHKHHPPDSPLALPATQRLIVTSNGGSRDQPVDEPEKVFVPWKDPPRQFWYPDCVVLDVWGPNGLNDFQSHLKLLYHAGYPLTRVIVCTGQNMPLTFGGFGEPTEAIAGRWGGVPITALPGLRYVPKKPKSGTFIELFANAVVSVLKCEVGSPFGGHPGPERHFRQVAPAFHEAKLKICTDRIELACEVLGVEITDDWNSSCGLYPWIITKELNTEHARKAIYFAEQMIDPGNRVDPPDKYNNDNDPNAYSKSPELFVVPSCDILEYTSRGQQRVLPKNAVVGNLLRRVFADFQRRRLHAGGAGDGRNKRGTSVEILRFDQWAALLALYLLLPPQQKTIAAFAELYGFGANAGTISSRWALPGQKAKQLETRSKRRREGRGGNPIHTILTSWINQWGNELAVTNPSGSRACGK